jgi:hypothetical protein
MSEVLGISKSTLHRYLQQGLIRRHSNSIKPHLTDYNKISHLRFTVNMVDQGSSSCGDPRFKELFDHVFIYEKWFFLTQKSENYYLPSDEDEPHHTYKSKNYIPRIMFLCVTARPRFRNGQCIFDGKIGCFPLVTYEHAQRRSANRPAGTLVVKHITSITRDVIKDFMTKYCLQLERNGHARK